MILILIVKNKIIIIFVKAFALTMYEEHPKIPVAIDCVIFGYEADELKFLCLKGRTISYRKENAFFGVFYRYKFYRHIF